MKLSEVVRGFLLNIQGDGYSSVTVRNYRYLSNKIVASMGDVEFEQIKSSDITDFFDVLRKQGLTNSTVQVYWKIFRSIYNFAEKELGSPRPDKAISMPKYQDREIMPFNRDEVTRLIKACHGRRNKALVLMLYDTGLRVSEASRVMVKDVDLETGAISVRPFQTGLKSRARTVYMGKVCRKAIWLYLASREDLRKDDYVIANANGGYLCRSSVRGILDRIGKVAEVNNVHPHRFRHTFAVEFLRNGGDVFTLQRLLGHNSLEMVRHYLSLSQSDVEEAYRANSPADRMRL